MSDWIRIWSEQNMDDVCKHLLIVGDLMGDCGSCKELGIDYKSAVKCPNCGVSFKYVTSRRFETNPGERFQIVKRFCGIRRDLLWIDYDDYKKITGRQRAKDFFS